MIVLQCNLERVGNTDADPYPIRHPLASSLITGANVSPRGAWLATQSPYSQLATNLISQRPQLSRARHQLPHSSGRLAVGINYGSPPNPQRRGLADVPSGMLPHVNIIQNPLRTGTWNALSLNLPGNKELLTTELTHPNIPIIGLQEVRWTGCGETVINDYKFLWSVFLQVFLIDIGSDH